MKVCEPKIIARLGALGGRYLQPAAVTAHLNPVVIRHGHPGTKNHHIVCRRRADGMQIDTAVEVALGFRQQLRGDAPHIIKCLAAN